MKPRGGSARPLARFSVTQSRPGAPRPIRPAPCALMPPFPSRPSPLQESLRREAGKVWREKANPQRLGLQLNEETITETALFRFASSHPHGGLSIRAFNKGEEKRIGADWEWWFVRGNNGVGLRVQAKRLFLDGTYKSLKLRGSQNWRSITSHCCASWATIPKTDCVGGKRCEESVNVPRAALGIGIG